MQRKTLSGMLLTLALLLAASSSFAAGVSHFSTVGPAGLTAELELEAAPLLTMKTIPFTLSLADAAGNRLTALNIACDLTMPAMPMPKNQPRVTATDKGYTGYLVFTMAGAWQATFTARDADNQNIRLVFDIPEVLLK